MGNGFDKSHPYYSPATQSNPAVRIEIERELKNEIEIKQTEALTSLAEGVQAISQFLRDGGLQSLVAANTKGQIIQAIFGGLASKEGRNSLDARTIKQNSLEIVEIVEQVFSKMHERMQAKERDPEIKEPTE